MMEVSPLLPLLVDLRCLGKALRRQWNVVGKDASWVKKALINGKLTLQYFVNCSFSLCEIRPTKKGKKGE